MNLKEELIKLKDKCLEQQNRLKTDKEHVKILMQDYTEEEISKYMETVNFASDGFLTAPVAKVTAEYLSRYKNIYLNKKVDNFIKWYSENMVKGNYTDIGEFHIPTEMRNFIEKMAVWYELRYPDYEIKKLMNSSNQKETKINDIMFNNNKYINDLFDENADVKDLDWDEFYNAKIFIHSLPNNERYLFQRPRYQESVYFSIGKSSFHLHLTKNGYVKEAEGAGRYTGYKVDEKDLTGMHIKDVINLLEEKGIAIPYNSEFKKAVYYVDKRNYQKEEMLNCVMYRIIERGGNRIGPRRAFLFAKEFRRNIDIPMKYGIDYSDPNLRAFINEYLKAGGSLDLDCYENYFIRTSDNKIINTIKLKDVYKLERNYTAEEKALYQRMVNSLSTQIDYEELQKLETKQKRLQRKLAKSRNNKNAEYN